MKNVLVIINNPEQASYRLRVKPLPALLAPHGITLDVRLRPRGFLARRRLLGSARDYDAVLLQRKLLDPADARLLRRSARGPVFYDVDDAVMFSSQSQGWLSRWRTSRRFHATASAIDVVVAGNDYLAELFTRAGAACAVVVPTVVDVKRYAPKVHRPTDAPTLVWIGSRSTLPYLQEYAPALAAARDRVPGLNLITIADATLTNPPLPTRHIPWSEAGEADALIQGDIGVAPTPVDPWTLGKCGFKIVQYMACGLPVVASPVGANEKIVISDETGFLAETQADWADKLGNWLEMKHFGLNLVFGVAHGWPKDTR